MKKITVTREQQRTVDEMRKDKSLRDLAEIISSSFLLSDDEFKGLRGMNISQVVYAWHKDAVVEPEPVTPEKALAALYKYLHVLVVDEDGCQEVLTSIYGLGTFPEIFDKERVKSEGTKFYILEDES